MQYTRGFFFLNENVWLVWFRDFIISCQLVLASKEMSITSRSCFARYLLILF